MTVSNDELAGVVDMFGALTREELRRSLDELAFKRGESVDEAALSEAIDAAIESYHLVETERDGETLVVPGPVAFPMLPPRADDLPHILDVAEREVDRNELASDVEQRIRVDAARAVGAGDRAQIERLLDVTYDLETWGPVDVSEVRERLDVALQD